MSFPRYERYKESGVGWLGKLPEHWKVSQSRRLFSQRKDRARDDDRQLTASQAHGIIFQDEFMEREGRSVVRVIHGADILKHVEPNDFVISMRSFQGGIEWSENSGSISSAYVMLVPSADVNPAYFRYLFKSTQYIQALQSTTNLVRDGQALRFENFTLVDLPLLPWGEQEVIAAFLDLETAKIDALVEEQRRLIELLKEKRQAVISHAVTKGLNPDAPMKDSGIEGLGRIPTHWEIVPLKYFSRLQRGHDLTSDQQEEGPHPVVTSGGITGSHSKFMAKAPGVVTGRYGSTGRLFYIEEDYWPHNTALYVSDFYGNNPRFVWYTLHTLDFAAHSVKSAVPGIDRNDLHVLPVVAPPNSEQSSIVEFLETQMRNFDNLCGQAESGIALLLERRSALISAAVTGKIDVRGLLKEEAA